MLLHDVDHSLDNDDSHNAQSIIIIVMITSSSISGWCCCLFNDVAEPNCYCSCCCTMYILYGIYTVAAIR